tara:strand:+ start:824 stop:1081 length:258 start_codon:yes stop_codon:yes gene_type:complete
MTGLFEQWIQVEREAGKKQKDSISELNAACNTKYTESWPSKMQGRGFSLERTPTDVRRYMMARVLPTLIEGKSEAEYKKLIINLT